MNQKENIIQKRVRKASISAQDQYDWGKVIFPQEKCLASTYEEEKEELVFTYQVKDYQSFCEIKKERKEDALICLIDCAALVEVSRNYKVSLNPENLYYDIHNCVYVMCRDIYGKGEEFSEEEFLNRYRALIGFVLQDKYRYEDYYDGGLNLLQKDKFLEKILNAQTIEDIVTHLYEELARISEHNQKTKIQIDKRKYHRKRVSLRITSVLLIAAAALCFYEIFWLNPYEQSVIKANRDYLKINYSGVIEDFKNTDIARMEISDKYILAYSYVQCENLTEEQKKNIVSALSLDTNEKILDYWIYLGQLEVSEAENIALQLSDDDLLLYAYLKEKNMLETDVDISGSEKEKRIGELDSKIDKLLESGQDGTTKEDTTKQDTQQNTSEENDEGENGENIQ